MPCDRARRRPRALPAPGERLRSPGLREPPQSSESGAFHRGVGHEQRDERPATTPLATPRPHDAGGRAAASRDHGRPDDPRPRRDARAGARSGHAHPDGLATSAIAASGSTRAIASTGHARTHAGPCRDRCTGSHFTATCADAHVSLTAPAARPRRHRRTAPTDTPARTARTHADVLADEHLAADPSRSPPSGSRSCTPGACSAGSSPGSTSARCDAIASRRARRSSPPAAPGARPRRRARPRSSTRSARTARMPRRR